MLLEAIAFGIQVLPSFTLINKNGIENVKPNINMKTMMILTLLIALNEAALSGCMIL